MTVDMACTSTNIKDIMQGRKSFPSGHASFAFLSCSFIAFYYMGKLNVFNEIGRGSATKLSCCLAPLVAALLVAISRTCDYHHHFLDVFIGSLLGLAISYLCYRQYYPSLTSKSSSKPYPLRSDDISTSIKKPIIEVQDDNESTEAETQALLENKSS